MNSNEINIITTDYIYIPYNKEYKLFFKEQDYIHKEELIMESDNKKIYSTVSGTLLGLTTLNNKKYLVIENDYKDKLKQKKGSKRFINKYTRDELNDLLNEYKIEYDTTSKVLIINGMDEYKDEITYNTLIKNYTIEILDTIDALIEILNIKKCFLSVSNADDETVNILLNNIGTYPKIDLKIFTNDNIISKKEVLVDKLTRFKTKKYKEQYLSLFDVLKLYKLLKSKRILTNTFLTVYDVKNNIKQVINVSLGSNLKDVLKELNIDDKNIVINGLLNGISIKDTNFIIDENIRSIFITKLEKFKEKKCINCGLCLLVCPININPKYMYFNKDEKSKKYKEMCINCGLCSYNCPSKINLNKGCNND